MLQIENEEMVDIEKQNAIINIVSLMATFEISLDEIHERHLALSKYSLRGPKTFTEYNGKFNYS